MNDSLVFNNLVQVVETIAHNPPLPGDRKALCRCMGRLDEFLQKARITVEQWERLKNILLDAYP
jgi:hypothetical protein